MAESAAEYNARQYALRIRRGLCRNCGLRKPRKGKVSCAICAKRLQGWYAGKRDVVIAYQKKYRSVLKDAAFEAYGGYSCACCGDDHKEFLTIDHIEGKGAAHRREIGRGGHVLYLWLKRNSYPKGFRVLCMNCNLSYGIHGYCPHQKETAHGKRRRNDQVRRR